MIPGTQLDTNHTQRCDFLLIPYPMQRVLKIEITPEGMLSRAAFLGEKPKSRMSVAEYVLITPEDILGLLIFSIISTTIRDACDGVPLTSIVMMDSKIKPRSREASRSSVKLNAACVLPVARLVSRVERIVFSASDKNFACDGESGSNKNVVHPRAAVITPSARNMILQLCIAEFVTC